MPRHRLRLESLESRRMMAATPEFVASGSTCTSAPSQDANVTYLITTLGEPMQCVTSFPGAILVRTDGTTSGSVRVGSLGRRVEAISLAELGGDVYFVSNEDGVGLAATLGRVGKSGGDVERLFGPTHLPIGRPIVVRDKVRFSVGRELWETDGTKEGTRFVAEPTSPTGSAVGGSVRTQNVPFVTGMKFIGSLEEINKQRDRDGEPRIMEITRFFRVHDTVFFNSRITSDNPFSLAYGVFAAGFNPALPGDVQKDGDVDFDDFLILSANFGKTSGALIEEGDLDGDDDVDFDDFVILAEHFGRKLEDGPVDAALAGN